MVFINSEGKFNDNSYLIDGYFFGVKKGLAIYVVENNGKRLLIDTSSKTASRQVVKKLKELNIFPIHKIVLTHSHFDHTEAADKLKNIMNVPDFEIMASEKAINNLKNPEIMNEAFEYNVDPLENVKPLKEGDIIDLNGLKLNVLDFFGHTQDSIAIYDKKNKNIFVGDAIIDRMSYNTFNSVFLPPDFNETELIKTFKKLRNLKENLNSISLAHFGVWTDEDCQWILENMEDIYFNTKNSIIKWYMENPSKKYVAAKYHEKFIPKSRMPSLDKAGFENFISWLIMGLKMSGYL